MIVFSQCWPNAVLGAEHSTAFSSRRMFETFSYLPPLSDDQIARQVDYIVNNGYTPCLEFSMPEDAYVSSQNAVRFGAVSCVSVSQRQKC
jgi:ribulose-bisphosphate carboxylase small chain